MRLRLEEKEATLNKKSKQIQEMSEEKGTLNGEIHDLKDMLEVKERKINVLQKKVTLTENSAFLFLKWQYVSNARSILLMVTCVFTADREPAGTAEGQGEADEQPEGESKVFAG